MSKLIIVTGTHLKKVGHEVARAPYARVARDLSDIRADESVWSGVLRWIKDDPEGRYNAGWVGPYNLIVPDYNQESDILALESQIADARSAIDIAENGYQGVLWRAATEQEIETGLSALESLPDLEKAHAEATVKALDNSDIAVELEQLRTAEAEKLLAERAAAVVPDLNKIDWQVVNLIGCLTGERGSCGVRDNGAFYISPKTDRVREWSRSQLSAIPEIVYIKQISANHENEKVREFFKF